MQTHCCEAPDLHAWIVEHDPLRVVPLDDVLPRNCFDVRGTYVERYWLPILGPSCVLALRQLANALEQSPSGFELPLAPFARSVGLGSGIGRCSPIVRTLGRLDGFGFAHATSDHYAVRLLAPALSRRQVRLLPDFLAELHRREVESPLQAATACAGQSRGGSGRSGRPTQPTSVPFVGPEEAR
jgi:hypothetical protein